MTGAPVTIVDECAARRPARTLTFFKATDRIIVDGNEEIRTHQAGSGTARHSACGHAPPRAHRQRTPVNGRHSARTISPKSYSGRTVVRGVSLEVSLGRSRRSARAERRGQDDDLLHDRRADARRIRGASMLDGADVTDDPMYIRARKGIGYLPQEPSIFRGLTVEQNIMAILETLRPRRAGRARTRCASCWRNSNLTPLASRRPTRCRAASGGGPRSRAPWSFRRKFILLDEPFAGIDPIAVTDIQKIIFHLKERGIGVLITDHNVRETLRITDRAYIVHDGVDFPQRHPGRAGR